MLKTNRPYAQPRNYPRKTRSARYSKEGSFRTLLALLIYTSILLFIFYLVYNLIRSATKEEIVLSFFTSFFSRPDIIWVIFSFVVVICIILVARSKFNSDIVSVPSRLIEDDNYTSPRRISMSLRRMTAPLRHMTAPLPRRPQRSRIFTENNAYEFEDDEDFLAWPESPTKRIEKIILEKKQKFLNIPNISFQFANHEQIKTFYNVYFEEPTIESITSEVAGGHSRDVKGSVPQIIDAHIGGTNTNKWTSNITVPILSSNAMFLRYQKETIKRGQVTLGIEEVDIELTELEAFEDAITNIKERFGLEIDEVILSKQRSELKEKAAEKTLSKLEQITDWILIEGRFKVEKEEDLYKCIYIHPVNSYLSGQIIPVTISVLIPANSIEEHIKGNYAQSIGKSIPLKIYGQVWQPVDRKTSVWELQLTPLAVY